MPKYKEEVAANTHTQQWHGINIYVNTMAVVENELERSYFMSVKTNDRNFTHIIPSGLTHFNDAKQCAI